jgi:hypothetical protein
MLSVSWRLRCGFTGTAPVCLGLRVAGGLGTGAVGADWPMLSS